MVVYIVDVNDVIEDGLFSSSLSVVSGLLGDVELYGAATSVSRAGCQYI